MDVSQYLEIFLDEAREHLQNLNTRIMELESDPESMDTINEGNGRHNGLFEDADSDP